MLLIPAIDIMGGSVVRLKMGDPSRVNTYKQFGDPLQTAKKWKSEGAEILHVVDLDATLGIRNNREIIREIIKRVDIRVQVGGGLRSFKEIKELFKIGVWRVILGTIPFENEALFLRIIETFDKVKIIIAFDCDGERLKIKGWREYANLNIFEAVEKFFNFGIKTFLLTSISSDGMLTGPNYNLIKKFIFKFKEKMNFIIAGGISSLNDLEELKNMGINEVVLGRALYEEKFSFRDAIQILGDGDVGKFK